MTSATIVDTITRKVNSDVDLLVVDIDSYDFFVVRKILNAGIKPRVLVVEYNPHLPIDQALSWPDGKLRVDGLRGRLYGASYLAWEKLANKHGYNLVHVSGMCNLIYVRSDLDPGYTTPNISDELTDAREKVLSFCEEHCLPGFLTSWIDEPELDARSISSLSVVTEAEL